MERCPIDVAWRLVQWFGKDAPANDAILAEKAFGQLALAACNHIVWLPLPSSRIACIAIDPRDKQDISEPGVQNRSAWEEPIGISLVNDEEADLVTDSRLVGVHEATRVAQCFFRQIGDSKRGHSFLQAYRSRAAVQSFEGRRGRRRSSFTPASPNTHTTVE